MRGQVAGGRSSGNWRRLVFPAAKLSITGICFWYLARNIDLHEAMRAAYALDLLWASLATLAMMLQISLVGLRWREVIEALDQGHEPVARGPIIAILAISNFFAQVVPSIAADAVRSLMLADLRSSWRRALISVAIDRAVGVVALAAVGIASLLLPSAFGSFGGYRTAAVEVFAAILAATFGGLLLGPYAASMLERWDHTRWAGRLAAAAHSVLLSFPAGAVILGLALCVHVLTIVAIWLLGFALDLPLAPADAAVLFTVILGAALVPVSIGGWGVRELALTALLERYNIPFEKSLVFSVSFGLVVLVAALPGAIVWAFYSPQRLPGGVAASHL